MATLTFDYRGVHESQSNVISGSDIQMVDWGKFDINATLEWTIKKWQPNELIFLGHSCGGQLLGLAKQSAKISKALFVASQSGYWKLWPKPQQWGLLAIWQTIPLLTPFFDDFPARSLGLSSVNIPSGVAQQWAKWGKSPNYLWDFIPTNDLKRYRNLSFPLLSLGFLDDQYFGPPKSVKTLLSYYTSVQSELRIISASDYNIKSIGHFGFLKENLRGTLWNEMANWMKLQHT